MHDAGPPHDETRDRSRSTAAIDDGNWRPTRAGTTMGVLVTVAAVATLVAVGGGTLAAVAGVAGGVSLAAVLFATGADGPTSRSRRRVLARVAASALLLPAGALLVAGVGLTLAPGPVRPGRTALVVGVAAAAGGAAALPWDAVDGPRLRTGARFGIAVLAAPTAVLAFLALVTLTAVDRSAGAVVALAADGLLATTPSWRGAAAPPVAAALVGLACLAARTAVRALPLGELAPADRRAGVVERSERVGSYLTVGLRASGVSVVAFAALWLAPSLGGRLFAALPGPLVAGLHTVAASTPLRVLLLCVVTLCTVVVGLVSAVKRLPGVDAATLDRWGGPAIGGALLVVVALRFGQSVTTAAVRGPLAARADTVRRLSTAVGPGMLVLGVAVTLAAVPVAVYLALALLDLVVLPERGASAAVASAGVFVAAIGGAHAGVTSIVVFGAVVASLVIWDVSTHAVGMGAEVGRAAHTRHVELVHAGGSAVVGAIGVAVAVGGLIGASALPVLRSVATPLALLSALVGVVFLLVALRSA